MNNFAFFLDIATDYVSFGLALYAIGAILASIWVSRHKSSMSAAASVEILHAGSCVFALVLLEITRQFSNSFPDRHFFFWITRLAFPVVYLVLGNSTFRLTHVDLNGQPEHLTNEAGSGR